MKVLHLNTGYGSMLTGESKDILSLHKYFIRSKKTQNDFIEAVVNLVEKENPDIIFFTELKKSDKIIEVLSKKYPYYGFGVKYKPHRIESKIIGTKNNGNAFFSKIKPDSENHRHLSVGRKSLVLEVLFGNIKFFLVHLSLLAKDRKKQFQEICSFMADNSEYQNIIVGDFNFFVGGISEFKHTCLSDLDCKITTPTFPSAKPLYTLDVFLTPKDLKCKSRVLDDIISDHLPIILEIQNSK